MKTKSVSETARKLTKKLILLAIIALALSVSPRSRADASLCGCLRSWDNSGAGDWFDPSNWAPYHDYLPSCGGPICPEDGGTTEADINNGGTAQISTLAQTAQACEVFIGKDSGQSGNLSVDHATLDQCNDMWVGYYGKGTLKITNGGLVTTIAGGFIAGEPDSSGTATVDGTNPDGRKSTWTVIGAGVGVGGTGGSVGGTALLTVTNQAQVSADNVHVWKSGTLTGNGTVTTTNGPTTVDGTLAPSGTFTINGNLTFGSIAANMRCNVSSTSVDNSQVSGRALLNGKLSVTVSVTGDFTLLHAANGFNNTQFSSYSFTYTGCLSASVSYRNNNDGSSDVILHVISTCN
jgi:T5SS/PEP-CTERM-associated repeat protein